MVGDDAMAKQMWIHIMYLENVSVIGYIPFDKKKTTVKVVMSTGSVLFAMLAVGVLLNTVATIVEFIVNFNVYATLMRWSLCNCY